MELFWDTSAVLPLILEEESSAAAAEANGVAATSYAWRWLRVEAEGAMARRGASQEQWLALGKVLDSFGFLDISAQQVEEVCRLNRRWRLRAGDAGHIYCLQAAAYVLPGIQLVCFDEEMLDAARKLKLRVWQPALPFHQDPRMQRGRGKTPTLRKRP